MSELSDRYSRHLVLKEIGKEGQSRIDESRVTILGQGALGTVLADGLARCGVGEIIIADRDFVELSNLQRQTLFDENDIGKPKAEVAEEKLRSINSDIMIEGHVLDVNTKNIENLIMGSDIVMDASDNMKLRFLLNDACIKHGIPWIYSAVLGTYGMTMNITSENSPCLRCLIPEQPNSESLGTCASEGILFTLPRVIANIAATEAVKFLVGMKNRKELLTIDLWRNEFDLTEVRKKEDCNCCVNYDFKYLEGKEDETVKLCGREAVQITPSDKDEVNLDDFVKRYREAKKIGEHLVRLNVENYELNIFKNGRVIIKGTEDINKAKSLYADYIGR
ncbi:MAG: ThiF family adenylyltransferase [Candidatus Saliniplasma sp.]